MDDNIRVCSLYENLTYWTVKICEHFVYVLIEYLFKLKQIIITKKSRTTFRVKKICQKVPKE